MCSLIRVITNKVHPHQTSQPYQPLSGPHWIYITPIYPYLALIKEISHICLYQGNAKAILPTSANIWSTPKQYCPYISAYRPHQRDYTHICLCMDLIKDISSISAYIRPISKRSCQYLSVSYKYSPIVPDI